MQLSLSALDLALIKDSLETYIQQTRLFLETEDNNNVVEACYDGIERATKLIEIFAADGKKAQIIFQGEK